MPVPGNTPALTLGRTLFDKRKFRPDTDPAVIDCLAMLSMERAGAGWSGPAKGADEVYMAVYAQSDGGGAHNLYGGNPADPVNPFPLTVSASGSATVDWEEEGTPVLTSGTANFVGTGVTVTDVAGTATITITSGAGTVTEAFRTIAITEAIDAAGQSDVVADSATDTLTLEEVFGIAITTNSGADTIGFAFRNGDGLESDGGNPGVAPAKVRVKAHTYIDVTSSGVAVDFTEVASYSGASDQYLRNNAGTFQWATLPTYASSAFSTISVLDQDNVVADSASDTLTLVAGAGHTIETDQTTDTITHKAAVHDASHVGLVDPTTGDDSTADDAQIGILWHEIANYDSTKDMLVGHAANDTTKPVVEYKTVADWLKTLPQYDAAKKQVLTHDAGTVEWNDVDDVLNWLAGYVAGNLQSIGHDVSGDTEWQDDDDACP
jgi:hypothetical protein